MHMLHPRESVEKYKDEMSKCLDTDVKPKAKPAKKEKSGPKVDVREVREKFAAFLVSEARNRGFFANRISRLVGCRMWGESSKVIVINGRHCSLHISSSIRPGGYTFVGFTKATLEDIDVVALLQGPFSRKKKYFLVPSSVLLSVFPDGRSIHRFYVPTARKKNSRQKIDWFAYRANWDVFGPSRKNTTSASSG